MTHHIPFHAHAGKIQKQDDELTGSTGITLISQGP